MSRSDSAWWMEGLLPQSRPLSHPHCCSWGTRYDSGERIAPTWRQMKTVPRQHNCEDQEVVKTVWRCGKKSSRSLSLQHRRVHFAVATRRFCRSKDNQADGNGHKSPCRSHCKLSAPVAAEGRRLVASVRTSLTARMRVSMLSSVARSKGWEVNQWELSRSWHTKKSISTNTWKWSFQELQHIHDLVTPPLPSRQQQHLQLHLHRWGGSAGRLFRGSWRTIHRSTVDAGFCVTLHDVQVGALWGPSHHFQDLDGGAWALPFSAFTAPSILATSLLSTAAAALPWRPPLASPDSRWGDPVPSSHTWLPSYGVPDLLQANLLESMLLWRQRGVTPNTAVISSLLTQSLFILVLAFWDGSLSSDLPN